MGKKEEMVRGGEDEKKAYLSEKGTFREQKGPLGKERTLKKAEEQGVIKAKAWQREETYLTLLQKTGEGRRNQHISLQERKPLDQGKNLGRKEDISEICWGNTCATSKKPSGPICNASREGGEGKLG